MKQLFFPTFFLIGCSEKYADFSILDASRENNLNAVIQHLNNCADVNQKDRYIGYTPLHYSAWNGDIDIAELLIVKGANLNVRDKKNNTPLDVAVKANKIKIASYLRNSGAKTSEELKAEGK